MGGASATSRSIDGASTWLGRKQRAGTIYRDADGSVVTREQAWGGMASLRVGLERAL